ncbi:hypothetical protein GOP47_0010124 [Adiantum capillus-veneris]|uniref:Uncharacterized protein n=1 Tax=Adiantum capillus-veneris TaxID=13818 RepID=A0A9D4UVA7_ADICA|nr:hypothetical protein GOP47_0010124 [Adiantum capillus-veneris]
MQLHCNALRCTPADDELWVAFVGKFDGCVATSGRGEDVGEMAVARWQDGGRSWRMEVDMWGLKLSPSRDFTHGDTIISSGHYGILIFPHRIAQKTGNNDCKEAKDQFGDSLDIKAMVTTTNAAMKVAFQAMYGLGARTFIFMNAIPKGCSRDR